MTTNPEHAERFVAKFREGWQAQSDEHYWAVWDEVLHPDVYLVQPMMPSTRGVVAYRKEIDRLREVFRDLRAEVHDWAARERTLFIHFTLCGVIGGEEVRIPAVDRFTLDAEGRAVERHAYFDSMVLAPVLLRHPTLWPEALRRVTQRS